MSSNPVVYRLSAVSKTVAVRVILVSFHLFHRYWLRMGMLGNGEGYLFDHMPAGLLRHPCRAKGKMQGVDAAFGHLTIHVW